MVLGGDKLGGDGEGREREGGREWEWQNERGLEGVVLTKREAIG